MNLGTSPEVRAARIAAAAAIVAAILSGASGAFTVIHQVSAEDRRSSSEFLRERREAAFARFIEDHQSLIPLEEEYHVEAQRLLEDSIEPNEYLGSDELDQLGASIRDNLSRLNSSFAAVELVASSEVSRYATQIHDEHQAMANMTADLWTRQVNGDSGPSSFVDRSAAVDESVARAQRSYDLFKAAARADLGG